MVARGHGTNLFALYLDGISGTRDGTVEQFDAYNLLLQPQCLLLGQSALTDKLLLVELDEDAQSGFERSDVIAELMSVEWESHLEAQGVAAAESARKHLARCDERVPYLIYIGVRAIQLKSIFACISSTAGNDGLAINLDLLECVEGKVANLESQQALYHLFALGALHGHLSVVVRLVVDDHIVSLALLYYPGMVLIDVRCVHHKQIFPFAHGIYEQVIHATSIRVAHDAVVNFTVGRTGDVVGEDVVDKLLGIRAGDEDFAHV